MLLSALKGHLFPEVALCAYSRALLSAADTSSHCSVMIRVLQVPTPVTPLSVNEDQVVEQRAARTSGSVKVLP